MTKMLSASGGLRPPNPLTRALPLDPAGALPPDPRYRLVLRTRPGTPPPPLTPSAAYAPEHGSPIQAVTGPDVR